MTEHIITARKPRGEYKKDVSDEVKSKSILSKEEWSLWALDHWQIRPESAKRIGHPAPYPLEIPYRLIRMYSFCDDIVLDPFFGSGTTGLAAHKTGRNYIGYEIHKEYINIFKSRTIMQTDIFSDETEKV